MVVHRLSFRWKLYDINSDGTPRMIGDQRESVLTYVVETEGIIPCLQRRVALFVHARGYGVDMDGGTYTVEIVSPPEVSGFYSVKIDMRISATATKIETPSALVQEG
jgi:hypothetical protein